jgi:hypothetical protein
MKYIKLISMHFFCLLLSAHHLQAQADAPTPLTLEGYYDLSQVTNVQAVITVLSAAGITQDKYPQLYNSLNGAPSIYQMAQKNGVNLVQAITTAQGGGLQPMNVLAPSAAAGKVSAEAVASIPNQPYAVANAVGISAGSSVVAAPQGSVTIGGPGHIATTVSGNQTGASQYTANGVTVYVYPISALGAVSSKFSMPPTTSVAFAAPLTSSFADSNGTDIVNTSPTNVKGNGYIKACIVRGDADCDYLYGLTSGQWVVTMPIIGSVTFPQPVAVNPQTGVPTNASYNVAIWYPDVGGGCQMPDAAFASQVTVNGNVLSWNANPAQFGTVCSQIPYGVTQSVTYQLTMLVQNSSGGLMTAKVTTQQGPTVANTLRLLPLEFVYGCLAPGTEITMADGGKQRIEKVRADQYVQGIDDSRLRVSAYSRGPEHKGLWEVMTANKKSVRMTDMHPMPLLDGSVRLAKNLRVGDIVSTDKGPSKIVRVSHLPYSGMVWNLDLGTPVPPKAAININQHTFYANGILVGDGRAQTHYSREPVANVSEILARLPSQWHADFHSAELHKLKHQAP